MRASTCALISGQVSAYLDHAVSEAEANAIQAHLASCADCAAYLTQLRTTMDILGQRPGVQVPAALREALAAHTVEDVRLTELVTSATPQLLAVARAIDPEHAEDLVQNTWIEVLRAPGGDAIELPDLLARLDSLAERHRSADVDTEPLRDPVAQSARPGPDKDADTAELYYPGLYPWNADLGDGIDSVNSWPDTDRILSPEDGSTAEELYGVVDAALAELPAPGADLLSLVDIEGVPVDRAISALRLDPGAARRDLDRARDFVRHRVDAYVSSAR